MIIIICFMPTVIFERKKEKSNIQKPKRSKASRYLSLFSFDHAEQAAAIRKTNLSWDSHMNGVRIKNETLARLTLSPCASVSILNDVKTLS